MHNSQDILENAYTYGLTKESMQVKQALFKWKVEIYCNLTLWFTQYIHCILVYYISVYRSLFKLEGF